MTVEQLLCECELVRLTEEKLAACKPSCPNERKYYRDIKGEYVKGMIVHCTSSLLTE